MDDDFPAYSQRERQADCSSESDRQLQDELRSVSRRDLFSDSRADLDGDLQGDFRGLLCSACARKRKRGLYRFGDCPRFRESRADYCAKYFCGSLAKLSLQALLQK
jgi:hypothetical protein